MRCHQAAPPKLSDHDIDSCAAPSVQPNVHVYHRCRRRAPRAKMNAGLAAMRTEGSVLTLGHSGCSSFCYLNDGLLRREAEADIPVAPAVLLERLVKRPE